MRSEQMKELLRSVQVVEKSATENDIEDPIPLEVPNVVIDKRQIRKSKPLLHEAAFIKVCFPHLDTNHFAEAQPSQLDGVATLKTAQVCTAKPFVASGVKYAETSFRAQDPRATGMLPGLVSVPSARTMLWAVKCIWFAPPSNLRPTYLNRSAGVEPRRRRSRLGANQYFYH